MFYEYGNMQNLTEARSGLYVAIDSDDDLMRRVALGSQPALKALMQRHLPKTVRTAARILGSTSAAEDVAQEAFIRVWKNAVQWQDSEKAGARFSTWLYRIVMNLCIDEMRKSKHISGAELPDIADADLNAEEGILSREKSRRVKQALSELPERQRSAFVLCFYEEYSNKEAADMMEISVKALESLLVRARRDLREKLKNEKVSS